MILITLGRWNALNVLNVTFQFKTLMIFFEIVQYFSIKITKKKIFIFKK